MKPEFMRLRRALALALATLLSAAGLALLSPASAALAHHNTVSVSAACVDNTWTITWKITNSERYKSETITQSNQPAIVPVGTTIGAAETFVATETVDGPIYKTLTVVGHWPSGKVTDKPRSATITPNDFRGTCEQPPVYPPVDPQPPVTPEIALSAQPCVYAGTSTTDVTASVTGLPNGATYTVRLFSGPTVVDSATGTAGTGTVTATFSGLAPGDYRAEVEATGSTSATSSTITAVDCAPQAPPIDPEEPLPPVSTPRLVITPVDCSSDVTTPTVSVSVTGLDAAEEYEVVLLNETGASVASQIITGVTNDEVIFQGLEAPASYAAVLQLQPGGSVVSETVDLADVVPCIAEAVTLPTLPLPGAAPSQQLPTLPVTGPGEFAALAAFAALLLTAGGFVVTTRLRRRAALALDA
ncbi:hypothetical protein FVA74_03135 [Salinibacterium sp. dk2585]|uniref:hypothetical protein n=1 Tax=unclassified Salinibacterium TaxID=2632331 RepID=UPI0011C24EC8|nr:MULTISPECIES: hypothetical protein [unclassified Salinibacterium]QEE60680.1 hypothetical protein FVA74_03135 [Salinibacterium sp. dk2585]TXK55752.1 hypothetical protein FVP63_03280 [Salinibacterium sp. dk5596]